MIRHVFLRLPLLIPLLVVGCADTDVGGEPWELSAADAGSAPTDPDADEPAPDTDPDEPAPDPDPGPAKVDLLWVIDNSASMCEEQDRLRESFRGFLDQLRGTEIDFHIAVTTTTRRAPYEAVAEFGAIQSTPHPPVGFDDQCAVDENSADKYGTLRNQIKDAVACTENPEAYEQLLDWTDADIACAVEDVDQACAEAGRDPDAFERARLFPCGYEHEGRCTSIDQLESVYREIPKVLDTDDYRRSDGSLDIARLQRDFACASFVGTRGDSMEQGLRAAARAVSPEMTGGPEETPIDSSAPNHGFLRRSAQTAVMFVSDENDCSHPEDVDILGEFACGEMGCYYPTTPESNTPHPLYAPQKLADRFRRNLADSKGVDRVDLDDIVVGTLHGGYAPYGTRPGQEVVRSCGKRQQALRDEAHVCSSQLGSATSGDRFEDFLLEFDRIFPERPGGGGHLTGWMCEGDFETPLEQFAGKLTGG